MAILFFFIAEFSDGWNFHGVDIVQNYAFYQLMRKSKAKWTFQTLQLSISFHWCSHFWPFSRLKLKFSLEKWLTKNIREMIEQFWRYYFGKCRCLTYLNKMIQTNYSYRFTFNTFASFFFSGCFSGCLWSLSMIVELFQERYKLHFGVYVQILRTFRSLHDTIRGKIVGDR